ncbi:MAG: DNA-processing protein DprA [Candidatus Saccharimonadales bacterium]
MDSKRLTLTDKSYPEILRAISDPPKELFVLGPLEELMAKPRLAVVGSRKVTSYGRDITTQLAGAAAKHGVVIVSGLALGIDSLAHQAALDNGGLTVAVLPGPVDTIYPRSHHQLAQRILQSGGALISEYPTGVSVRKYHFIARNRLIAGISDATLVTEAVLKSGSLHTVRFALEQGREVMAVPGNITSPMSEGTNNLIKHGAIPITKTSDILFALGIDTTSHTLARQGSNDAETAVLALLAGGRQDGETLQLSSGLDIALFNQTLTMLEITGKVRSLGANTWILA